MQDFDFSHKIRAGLFKSRLKLMFPQDEKLTEISIFVA